MNKKIIFLSFCTTALLLSACKKNTTPAPAATTTAGTVLASEANVVIIPMYVTLSNDATLLYNGAAAFQATPTQQNLVNCRQLWLNATVAYEQSAATLFGPGGGLGADPASLINTYPIDTAGINQIINNNNPSVFTLNFIDSLPSYLTGFRGMEFELYGISGNKAAAQFTPQELSYIAAVALNIQSLTGPVDTAWTSSYFSQFAYPGNGGVYPDQRAAFSDLIMAIANITETDGIYKLKGIFDNGSDILQESPFANTSVTDIENNLIGVQDIYLCDYGGNTGAGLSAFVSQNNVALDLKLKTDMNTAILALGLITEPLPQAIHNQSEQIHLALNACDSLDDDLKVSLLTYMNANTN